MVNRCTSGSVPTRRYGLDGEVAGTVSVHMSPVESRGPRAAKDQPPEMSSDDRGNPSGGRQTPGDRDDAFTGDPIGDPVRDFVLGIAAQIDQLAAIIGGGGQSASSGATRGAGARHQAFGDVAGEISSLVAEIGDLVSRLIAALIAVLEAVANALRATPATHASPTAQYQPISVRIGTSTSHRTAPRQTTREQGDQHGPARQSPAGQEPSTHDMHDPGSYLPDPSRSFVDRRHLDGETET